MLGGNLNSGANAGLFYVNANNAPSNANWNYGASHSYDFHECQARSPRWNPENRTQKAAASRRKSNVAEFIGKTMAKTYGHTFDKIVDLDNIEAAIRAAAKGKRGKRSVQRALSDIGECARRVRDILVNDKPFLPEVREGHGIGDGLDRKKRVIVHPNFTEQIIDHAIIQVLAPHFMSRFFRWSCGSIPGRGQEAMVKHLMAKVRRRQEKAKYYALLDVAKCFDTIDADAVFAELKRYERDPRTLCLLRKKTNANTVLMPDGKIRKGGVPIGVFSSPWFVNIALNRVDHAFKDSCGIYLLVRFMDDIFVAHGNKRELRRAIDEATRELARFGLKWKTRPVIRKWAYGDIGKVRFCGVQFTRETVEVRDAVYLRAVKTARRIARKPQQKKRVTWYDASKIISYGGRFAAFESWNAFTTCVLRDAVSYAEMRNKISQHDKAKARSTNV